MSNHIQTSCCIANCQSCKPTPSPLTREQFTQLVHRLRIEGDLDGSRERIVLDTDAALRLTLAQQAQEIEELKRERDQYEAQDLRGARKISELCLQLAAAQARVKELESKETALKKHIETSKATLAAREAELEYQTQQTTSSISIITQHEQRNEFLESRIADLQTVIMERQNGHCKDCCCARSWEALEVTTPTGMSIVEHIEQLKHERDAAVQDAARLRDALAALYAVQNGSPLPSYDKDWNTAMQLTERALNRQHASGNSGGSANHGGKL